jgi:hypothetical protein
MESRRIRVTSPGCDFKTEPNRPEIKVGEFYRAQSQLKADLKAVWRGTVDYGDGSREQEVSPGFGGSLWLEHRYIRQGLYRTLIALQDNEGQVAAGFAQCLVDE